MILDIFNYIFNKFLKVGVFFYACGYVIDCVYYSRVVSSAEFSTDRGKGHLSDFSYYVNRNLSCN